MTAVSDALTRARPRFAVLIWPVGVLGYIIAILNRTSLGVAGEQAVDRLGIGPAMLAWLPVLQLLCYAVLQLPAGVVVDRLGPRRVLTCALALMGVGQLLMAVAGSYPLAAAARILLGCGDAMTFVSVLRLIVVWYPVTRVALLVQLTATLGMAGNLVSTVPLLLFLHRSGWTPTFLVIAVASIAVGGLLFAVVRDGPAPGVHPVVADRTMLAGLTIAWRTPGVRLGMWMLFTAAFPWVSFTMLWGLPFLLRGQGVPPAAASGLLTTLVLTNMLASPVLGHLAGRHPTSRLRWYCRMIGLVIGLWAVVLCWPAAHAPVWLLAVLAAALGLCGPTSMLGADIARTASPRERTATAAAVANSGGFVGCLAAILLIGLILGITDNGMVDQPVAFDLAFATHFLLFGLGVWRVARWRRAPQTVTSDPGGLDSATVLEVDRGLRRRGREGGGNSTGQPG
jgi:MFS family permease